MSMENKVEDIVKYKIKEKKEVFFMKRIYSLVNFKVSWIATRPKIGMHETIIIMGGMITTIVIMITIRGVVMTRA